MAIDGRVQILEDEFRLIKGELKESLTDVRDFLLKRKVPAVHEAELPELDLHEESDPTMAETEEEEAVSTPEAMGDQTVPERSAEGKAEEGRQHTSQVNLLTNLIRWVASARRELGIERLPTFLEVYRISEDLSPELKQVILYLAEVTATKLAEASAESSVTQSPETNADPAATPKAGESKRNLPATQCGEANSDLVTVQAAGANADVWTRLLLELHGILSMSQAPLHSMSLSWDRHEETGTRQNAIQASGDRPEDRPVMPKGKTKGKGSKAKQVRMKESRPVRLKLVLPIGEGADKEFSIEEFSINLA